MHVVIVVDPITSKIITCQALVRRLEDEGNRVTLLVPPGRLEESKLADLGIEINLPDLRIDPPDRTVPDPEAVQQYQALLQSLAADLHLVDIEAHEYVMAAVATGLPVGLVNVFFNLWKQPGVPPVHQDVRPGVGRRGSRLGVAYGWWGYRVFRLRDILRSMMFGDDRRHHLLRFAGSLGLDPSKMLTEFHGLIPFQYRELETITLNLAELELPGGIHPLNHYVGPMPNLRSAGMAEAERDRIMGEVAELRSTRPEATLVYAAFGAYYGGDDLDFWRRAIATVGERPDWIGVFGLGGRIDPADLGPVPDNVRLYQWAPQLSLLAEADCAMIHGGMTSVYECIHHRVPMVAFPLGDSFDQFGTAARVAHHRIGLVGDRHTATGPEIAAMIDEVMADSELADRLETFGRHMARYRDDHAATSAIEAIAGRYSPG